METCKDCGTQEDIFFNNTVTNAWQKGDQNFYEFVCKECGTVNVVTIDIQDDDQTGEV